MPGSHSRIAAEERARISLATLVRLNQEAAGLKLRHAGIRASQGSGYLSAFRGRGMEFDETRPYLPGDDVRSLDWRVTARTGKAHTKLFREERERPTFLSVDARAAMFFATRGMFKFVLAARLAALTAWSALGQGDRVGGQLFTEDTSVELRPEHGRKGVLHLLQRLAETAAPRTTSDSGQGLDEALARLALHAHPGSLVLVLSDFRGLTSDGEASLLRLHRHCDVALLFIADPLEQTLPRSGRLRFMHGSRALSLTASPAAAESHAAIYTSRLEAVTRLARAHSMRHGVALTTDEPRAVLRTVLHRTHLR